MPSWNDKLSEWWDQSNTKNMILPALQGAFPTLPGGMLSNLVQTEGENLVNLAGGQITPGQAYSQSPVMQGFVEPLADFGSMVGQALDDPMSLWEADQGSGEAHIGQGPIEAAAGAAMTIPLSGLASGPLLDSLKWKLESHANQLGMSVDDLAQNVMNNPENWPELSAQHGPHIEAAAEETYHKPHYTPIDVPEQFGEPGGWEGIYPTDSHGMAYDPDYAYSPPPKSFDELHGLKTLGDGSFLVPEELDHLMDQGLSDEQISSMTLDQAHTALENTGYYPAALGGENWVPAGGQLPSPPSQIDLAQKPYYGTGSQAMDDLIAKADKKGWDPHVLAGKYTAGELDETDLTFHSLYDASNTSGPVFEPLKKPAPDPLAPKPLDTKKYPWLAHPVDPYGNSEFLNPRRDALFEPYVEAAHMQDIDIRDEISTLFKEGPEYHSAKEAADSRLRDIRAQSESLPPRSPIVPWAFNTRDPNWEAKARTLQLSDETKTKAAAMGFDPEQIYWKGTKYPEQRMLDPAGKPNAQMLYFSDKPDVGQYYGDWIYPTLLKMENPAVIDKAGSHYDEGWMKRFVQDSIAAGHESAIAKNMRDSGGIQDQFMVAHPSQVRSIWAKFDPKRAAEGDLLAAGNVPFNPFDFLAQTQEQKKRNKY